MQWWKSVKTRIKQFEATNQPPTNHQHHPVLVCLQQLGPQTCTKTGGSSPKSFHVTTWANRLESKNFQIFRCLCEISQSPLFLMQLLPFFFTVQGGVLLPPKIRKQFKSMSTSLHGHHETAQGRHAHQGWGLDTLNPDWHCGKSSHPIRCLHTMQHSFSQEVALWWSCCLPRAVSSRWHGKGSRQLEPQKPE